MKNYAFIVLCCFVLKGKSQNVEMLSPVDYGSVKQWNLKAGDTVLGKVFSIEKGEPNLVFYPTQSDFLHKTLIVTGTYTSTNDKVAGFALDENCNQVGNPSDAAFKSNAYLSFGGTAVFTESKACSSIPVYQLLKDGQILTQVIQARTSAKTQWRFLVKKDWTKTFPDGNKLNGSEWLIIDFDKVLSLTEACNYIARLQRNTKYQFFDFSSTFNACLLDTGAFRGFLLNGQKTDGDFPTKQSNVIVFK